MNPDSSTLLFYTDGEEASGLGHLRRSEALAEAAKKQGFKPVFLDIHPYGSAWLRERGWTVSSDESSPVAAMVIDSYLISKERIHAYRERYRHLVGFHDQGEPNEDFALVISSVYLKERVFGTSRILAGAQYKIVHPDVLSVHRKSISGKVSHIVVTFGYAPAMRSFVNTVKETLEKEFAEVKVRIVAGMPGDEAAKSFAEADVAISGGGQTIFELMYLGVPTVVVILSTDQEGQVHDAVARTAVRVAGTLGDADLNKEIAKSVRDLYSIEARKELSSAASKYIDGKGAERILGKITELIT